MGSKSWSIGAITKIQLLSQLCKVTTRGFIESAAAGEYCKIDVIKQFQPKYFRLVSSSVAQDMCN